MLVHEYDVENKQINQLFLYMFLTSMTRYASTYIYISCLFTFQLYFVLREVRVCVNSASNKLTFKSKIVNSNYKLNLTLKKI